MKAKFIFNHQHKRWLFHFIYVARFVTVCFVFFIQVVHFYFIYVITLTEIKLPPLNIPLCLTTEQNKDHVTDTSVQVRHLVFIGCYGNNIHKRRQVVGTTHCDPTIVSS